MSISRFLTTVLTVTLVSLFYVHQQIELVKKSYSINANERLLNELLDQRRLLEYNVSALKAPFNLEDKLEACDVKLVLPECWQVVRVASPRAENEKISEGRPVDRLNPILKYFTFSRVAQAKPAE